MVALVAAGVPVLTHLSLSDQRKERSTAGCLCGLSEDGNTFLKGSDNVALFEPSAHKRVKLWGQSPGQEQEGGTVFTQPCGCEMNTLFGRGVGHESLVSNHTCPLHSWLDVQARSLGVKERNLSREC